MENIIKSNLKKNKLLMRFYRKIIFKQLYPFFKKHLFRDLGLELFSYSLYKYFCQTTYKERKKVISSRLIDEFHKNNVLILDSLIAKDKVEEMKISIDSNIKNNKIKISDLHRFKSPLPSNKFLRFLEFLSDRYLKNVVYYYNFPISYINDEVEQVSGPIKNITGFKRELNDTFIPILNNLMNSNTDIHQAWAYKTINRNKEETHNRQSFLHRDGDIWTAIKCIIYLCDVNEDNGPFCYQNNKGEVVPVYGSAGTVIFFKNVFLRHKGSNTLKKERLAASFTAYPSYRNNVSEFDVRPDFLRKAFPFFEKSKECYL